MEEAVFLLVDILASVLIAVLIGFNRRIGVGGSLIASFLFTPFIGLIITILSKKTDE